MSRKQGPKVVKDNAERWLLTYADLITLLLAFFVVLYSASTQDLKKFEALAQSLRQAFNSGVVVPTGSDSVLDGGVGLNDLGFPQAQDLAAISTELAGFAAQHGLEDKIAVRAEPGSITISLTDNLLFAPASADLSPGSELVLREVAGIVRGLPNQVRVEGHTDNVPLNTGEYASNWELSMARATAVLRYLVDVEGISPTRLYGAGYGEFRPIADNDTPEGRAQNRRADIVIIYQEEQPS
ncbi:MAG TPA: OmpA family protein [Dehalococcoidia bacterium]